MSDMDLLKAAAERAAQVVACDNMAQVAQDGNYNAGQETLMFHYCLPAMQDAVMGGERSDGITAAGYDSHPAVEQALSDKVQEMTDTAEKTLELVDAPGLTYADLFDWA